jgi:adenylate cyclase
MALGRVRQILRDLGASEEEIARAERDEVIDLLLVDRTLFPSGNRYTQLEVATLTDLPPELLKRLWRALGFLDVDDHERVFTDLDLEAAEMFKDMLSSGMVEVESSVQLARVLGSSMARLAEAEVTPRWSGTVGPEDPVLAADAFANMAGPVISSMGRLMEFVWRRHLQAAARRTMLLRSRGHMVGASPVLAVGFADMVGFTLLSQHLTDLELADVVRRFEEVSHDIVTSSGGRVVKMIGDEVMFVVDGAVAAAEIALDLAEAYADDDLLSDVRVGLAIGSVLTSEGDYFGSTVNLAHRIVNIANPGTVIMSDEFWSTLRSQAPEEFSGQALRPRVLKDLGRVQLWWLGRQGQAADGTGTEAEERRRLRWERLAEVLRDLEELRGRGERLVTSGWRSALRPEDEEGTERPGGSEPLSSR